MQVDVVSMLLGAGLVLAGMAAQYWIDRTGEPQ